jgi:two-component system sensor histidine kinase UhpB
MNTRLKLLLLEDDASDAELIIRFLLRAGLEPDAVIVSDESEFTTALRGASFDAVLADNSLPMFSSVDALNILQKEEADAAFILVTGTVSEEFAVDIMHKGADDYILKGNLARLPAAIMQAIEKRRIKKEKLHAEEDLRRSNRELHELSLHLQNIREEERTQIARDIHDELGQFLTALKMDVQSLKKRIASNDEAIKHKFAEIQGLIEEAVQSVRRIAAHLRPGIIDDLGLVAALSWQGQEVEKRHGLRINFVSDQAEIDAPAGTVTGLFRIYQEALTNVIRHAHANVVNTRLKTADGRVTLEIRDDGRGIDSNADGKGKSFGLLGIKERVFLMGGQFEVSSEPGMGTLLAVSVPV